MRESRLNLSEKKVGLAYTGKNTEDSGGHRRDYLHTGRSSAGKCQDDNHWTRNQPQTITTHAILYRVKKLVNPFASFDISCIASINKATVIEAGFLAVIFSAIKDPHLVEKYIISSPIFHTYKIRNPPASYHRPRSLFIQD